MARSVRLALAGEFVPDAVNVQGGMVSEEVAPWLELVRKLGTLLASLAGSLPASIGVEVRGELAGEQVDVLSLAALRGVFSAVVEDQVTFVNAPALAEERGVAVTLGTETESPNHRSLVTLRGALPDGTSVSVGGTLSGPQLVQKVVTVNGRSFDLRAEGTYLVASYTDGPGVMGRVGTVLGEAGVNIEAAQISQSVEGRSAIMMLRVVGAVDDALRARVGETIDAGRVETVDLS